MAQDRPKQSNIQRELVRAAIIKLRASGLEISPHTIALEANIPRSTIYRNAELMELINKECGVNIESESPFQVSAEERIAELQAHVQEQDQHIWDLEKENEDLHSEVENAWTMGFQAGLAEAARRYSEPESEPVTAETALQKATGEHPLFRNTGTHAAIKKPTTDEREAGGEITGDHQAYNPVPGNADESVYHLDSDEQQELGIKVSISGGHQPLTAADIPPKQPAVAPQQAPPQPSHAPIAAQNFEPTSSSSSIQPLQAPAAPAPSRAQPHGIKAQSDIYNATRSGPYTGNAANPLVELSWKDLETVYNFRVESLMDYSRNIPSASAPARAPAGGNGAKPIISDYIDPEILGMLPSDEDIASLQNLEARVYMDESGDNGHTQAPPQVQPQPQAQQPQQQIPQELQPQDPPYQYYSEEPQAAASYRSADETGDRMEAMADPRLADGEHVIDLDNLDIFQDLDEYSLENLTKHAKKAAEDHFEGKEGAGDELRNLIKGRIASASDLPYEPVQSKVSPKASSTNLDAMTETEASGLGGSRNKFIGGKGGSAPPPNKASFVVKQIPPENQALQPHSGAASRRIDARVYHRQLEDVDCFARRSSGSGRRY